MTEAEIKNIAEDAAQGALRKFMLVLGVDISTDQATLELQKDFHHLRAERMAIGKVRDKIYATLTGSIVTAIIGAVGFYLTTKGH